MVLTVDHFYYTGITIDVKRRFKQHCGKLPGGAKFFKRSKAKKLVYIEAQKNQKEAMKRELAIKRYPPAKKRIMAQEFRLRKPQKPKILCKD